MFIALVLCSVFFIGDASFVGSLSKCGMSDSKCHKTLYQSVISGIGKAGVKELGIPPIDPLELKNVSVSILGLLDISLEEGIAKGVKDCVINDFTSTANSSRHITLEFDDSKTDIPNGHMYVDMTCDITVKGHYKAFSSSPLIKAIFGGDYIRPRPQKIGRTANQKVRINIDFTTYVHKDADGEVYVSSIYNKTKYDFEILGRLIFAANNVFMGDEDISPIVVSMLNQMGKSFAPYFGRSFMEKSLEFVYAYCGKFFEVVPARYYIKEDLTSFITS